MAGENFLVNPLYGKRFRNPLPGRLLGRMQRRYGTDGMSAAWRPYRKGIRVNELCNKREKLCYNPLGEEVIIVGANPRGRGALWSNAWFDDTPGHRSAALLGWRRRRGKPRKKAGKRLTVAPSGFLAKPQGRGVLRSNAWYGESVRPAQAAKSRRARRRGRKFRGNPVDIVKTVASTLPLAVTGGASIIATGMAPGFVGVVNPLVKYGVQGAAAVAGGMLVGKVIGGAHGTIWTVAGLAVIVTDVLQRYVLGRTIVGLGLGDEYEEMGAYPYEEMGAYPEESASGLSANPYETQVGPY